MISKLIPKITIVNKIYFIKIYFGGPGGNRTRVLNTFLSASYSNSYRTKNIIRVTKAKPNINLSSSSFILFKQVGYYSPAVPYIIYLAACRSQLVHYPVFWIKIDGPVRRCIFYILFVNYIY